VGSGFTKSLAAILLAQLASGCVTFTSTLSRESPPEADKGYIYGRFTMTTPASSRFGDSLLRMGVVFEEIKTGQTYSIQFQNLSSPAIVPVRPGTYRISQLVGAYATYESGGKLKINDERLSKEFRVEAGKAYYVGDFLGEAGSTFTIVKWGLKSIVPNYEATTNEFKKSFPQFENIDVVSVGYEYP
jgi:hypothetical protein